MKRTAFTFIGISTTLLAMASHVSATSNVSISNNGAGATSTVNVQTNTGNNTICVNGKCTTTGGEVGKSTVCINGKCTTSEGNVNVQSEDGSAKVNINNNSSSVTQAPKSQTKTSIQVNQQTLGENIDAKKEEAKKKAEEARKKAEEKIEKAASASNAAAAKAATAKNNGFNISEFLDKQLEFLRKIVTFQFLFGDK